MAFFEHFETSAQIFPNNLAVIYNDLNINTISYQELHLLVNNISNNLEKYIEKHACIGIICDSNLFYLPAVILSINKNELSFFCMESSTSDTILLNYINRLKLKWILINKSTDNFNSFLNGNAIKIIDISLSNKSDETLELWSVNLYANNIKLYKDIFYVIQTSGTTGENKIVQVFHNCIMSNIEDLTKIFGINNKDVIFMGTPITFDPFMVEIMLALTSGAALLITSRKNKFQKLIKIFFPEKNEFYSGVTILQMPPSVFFSTFSETIIENILNGNTSLKILALGGEKFPESLLNYQKKNLRIFNLYGITEVSCWSSVDEIKNNEMVSLGTPLKDTIFKINQGGELLIGSKQRICLINDESLKNETIFRETGDIVHFNQLTNKYYFYGRKNDIIKRFGHKVNLNEIEQQIFECTNLKSICVWDSVKSNLILFVILQEFDKIVQSKIIDRLKIKLLNSLTPSCYPDHVEIISKIPLTKNGKINKKILLDFAKLSMESSDFLLKTLTDKEIFEKIWIKYFGIRNQFNQEENFLNMGGNSILAIQLTSDFESVVKKNYSGKLTELFLNKNKNYSDYIKLIELLSTRKRNLQIETVNNNKISKKINNNLIQSDLKLSINWKFDLKACVDSTAICFTNPQLGDLVAIGSHSNLFSILKLDTGQLLSQICLNDAIEATACILPCKKFAVIGCNDGSLTCVQVGNCEIKWIFKSGDSIKTTPVLCQQNSRIIFGSYDKHLYCLNINNGSLNWKLNLKQSFKSNPIVDENNNCYVASIQGNYFCISIDKGSVIWNVQNNFAIFGTPCLNKNDKIILWADVKGNINIIDCERGDKIGIFETKSAIYSSINLKNDRILFSCFDHNIYCLKVTRLGFTEIYKVDIGAQITATPFVFNFKDKDYFVAVNNKGKLILCQLETGKICQEFQFSQEVFSSPIVFNNKIVIGCRDNNVYCIDIDLQ